MALTNLERFVAANPRPGGGARRAWSDDPRPLEILLQLFSTSQYFSELIIRDPASPAWLRDGADRRDRTTLIAELWDARARGRRTRRRSAWPCGGSGGARCSGSATTTSSAACRWS